MSAPDLPLISRPFVADWLRRMGPGTGGSLTIKLGTTDAPGPSFVVTAVRAPDHPAWTVGFRAGPHVATLHAEDAAYAASWIVALGQVVPECLIPAAANEVLVQ